MGDPNASIPTPQPVHYRPMFGALRRRADATSRDLRLAGGARRRRRRAARPAQARCVAVQEHAQRSARSDMMHNDATRRRSRSTRETYEVRADGELLTCEPATVLPMAQRYFLF